MSLFEAIGVLVERDGRVVAEADNLALDGGETLALLGPNGAGKTSLVLALAMLLPARGEIRLGGAPVRDAQAYRRRVGIVFQRPLLLDRSVRENAALGLALRGTPHGERDERTRSALARLGVLELAERRARSLSGGEAQRVSLARALALRPEVLFLDEPFSGLDGPTRDRLQSDLGRVLRDDGVATVFVTHDREEALALADRVGIVIGGRVRQLDRTDEVFRRPVDEHVAAFVGVDNVLAGQVERATDELTLVRVGHAVVSVADPPPGRATAVLVLIAPDDVVVSRTRNPTSERNAFEGRIVRLEPIGRRVRVTIDCGFPLVAHVTRQSARELALAPGDPVIGSFKATVPHLVARGN